MLNLVFQFCIDIPLTFLPFGSPEQLLILVRSNEVELRPESQLVPAPPTSPFPAPLRQTSLIVLDVIEGILVFCLLSVEGWLVLDLLIATIVISVFVFAISGGESILEVQLTVFWVLEDFMIVTTL